MASTNHVFHIQDNMKTPAKHHESFQMLWETKWKKPAEMGVYPFMFGAARDFEPIVEEMTKKGMKEPYDWDAYATVFIPYAEALTKIGERAEANNEKSKAAEFYHRASAIYRIARFPVIRSPVQQRCWSAGKAVFLRAQALLPYPVTETQVPHTHRLPHEGTHIPVYTLCPDARPAPVMVIVTGLDGYRTELAVWAEGWRALGVATVILEIPGTGDCPADGSDVRSSDRLFSSLLDWIDLQDSLDSKKVCVWGFSTGGYHTIRLAHTHAARLAGVIALGGGCHFMFERAWLDEVDHLEYPFDLAGSLAWKFGYGAEVEKFKAEGSRFSLLSDGTLDGPECARLLLVNGTEDEIFPIDDYYLALMHGRPKEVRFVEGIKHMGEPASFGIILKWLYGVLEIKANPMEQLKKLPFKLRYPTGEEAEVGSNGH
ncbi:alpha/beta-hydrolase [Pseudovirgaria hyperparasitica]|uniref:Alpha/beta-hydrolase n=1 Tax=Pseudovirgaria hyperparasitica TaxID=470096 RepID=A0A6A6WBF5_9PEZI|nr:alpha/beta-hydrolase [Pseudovirgaria hyperparasitica]KAF2760013.1 alpha/beta-hydrolase [Pseudovirgaria hyperparasitica]